MKFYTTQEYAQLKDVDESTVKKWAVEKKNMRSFKVHHSYPNMILDPDTPHETAIVGLMNLKGGAGKTTLAVHIAIWLAKIGLRVLVIDTDHQNQCRFFFKDQDYHYALNDILNGDADVNNGIYQMVLENCTLDIIYSSYSLALFARNYKRIDGFFELVHRIKGNYDFIIVDTSPNFDIINHNVANTVTHILIPVIPTRLHIEGVEHQIKALESIAQTPLERIKGIICNNVNQKIVEHKGQIELMREDYGEGVFDTIIEYDPWLEKVSTQNTNIFEYREKSKSSQALKKIVWELLKRA